MFGLGGAAKMPLTTDLEKEEPAVNLDLLRGLTTVEVFTREAITGFLSLSRDSALGRRYWLWNRSLGGASETLPTAC